MRYIRRDLRNGWRVEIAQRLYREPAPLNVFLIFRVYLFATVFLTAL